MKVYWVELKGDEFTVRGNVCRCYTLWELLNENGKFLAVFFLGFSLFLEVFLYLKNEKNRGGFFGSFGGFFLPFWQFFLAVFASN